MTDISEPKIVLVDAGNHSVKIAVVSPRSRDIGLRERLGNDDLISSEETLTELFDGSDAVLIASVRPATTSFLRSLLTRALPDTKAFVFNENICCPLKNSYEKGADPGIDRLLNCYGALDRTNASAIVVSFGSAITIDLVTPDQGFVGGCILPGLQWSFDAVSDRAAMISRPLAFSVQESGGMIGRSTEECIAIGVRWGIVGAVNYLVNRVRSNTRVARVFATGGSAELFFRHLRDVDELDKGLTFRAMLACYKRGVE